MRDVDPLTVCAVALGALAGALLVSRRQARRREWDLLTRINQLALENARLTNPEPKVEA